MSRPTVVRIGRRALSSSLAHTAARLILEGRFPPGFRFPAEQDVADALGINRATVREAVKFLEGIGLVTSKQGLGCSVNDYMICPTPEIVALLIESQPQLLADVEEVRRLLVRHRPDPCPGRDPVFFLVHNTLNRLDRVTPSYVDREELAVVAEALSQKKGADAKSR